MDTAGSVVEVEVLQSSTSRDSHMMVQLHYLSTLVAQHSFAFTATANRLAQLVEHQTTVWEVEGLNCGYRPTLRVFK